MAKNKSVRHQLDGTNTMWKYFAEIERMVFAAETYCTDSHGVKVDGACKGKIHHCPFHNKDIMQCTLKMMRDIVGEP